MSIVELDCSIQLDNERDPESGTLIFRLAPNQGYNCRASSVADRIALAAQWVVDLDAQYPQLIRAGHNPRVRIPPGRSTVAGRVTYETVAEYRKLQLGMGELIRPLLLDPPDMEPLYPFQRQGVSWLVERNGGILADDMGLGKTVQAITATRLLVNRAEIRTALVVCPKGLIATWEREFARWAPELGLAVITPPARIREEAWKVLVGHRHVLLTNYEQLRNPPSILKRATPDLIIADEAHRLRKPSAQITSGTFQLEAKRFWALTGTPIEHNLVDLTTLLSLVAPKYFAPADAAKLHPSSLRSRARPFILRRQKRVVLEELPPVLDTTESLELAGAQARAYRLAVKQHRQMGRKEEELALLSRLQTICDLDPESRESCKVKRILDLLGRIRELGEKAVVFSYRLDPLRELQRRITRRWGPEVASLLVGEMDDGEREHAVMHFRKDERALALLASSRVGGEGLTLVEANHVFLLNQWWNPSANDQARDRVVRIGQRRKVRIYRFCCRGTIEETLEEILKSKRDLFSNAVERLAQGESAAWRPILRDVGFDRLLSKSDRS